MEKTLLSIIIVNFNGEKYLKNCLNSVIQCCSSVSYEIIIVDNNSTDGSVSHIKSKYPNVKLFVEKKNHGFAKANNIGVKNAQGNVILLLNNDTILLNDITPLLTAVQKNEIGAIGIKMLNENKEYIHSFGKFPKPLQLIKLANLNETRIDLVSGNFQNQCYQMDWISGSFVLVTKEDWNLVNGLDEDYFMYVEDIDFCKKLQNLGKKILFYPNYSYIHFVGFNTSRELKLINGYKIYSTKHFNFVNATLAKICLHINYVYKRVFKNIR